jgi:hypothetical protein
MKDKYFGAHEFQDREEAVKISSHRSVSFLQPFSLSSEH